MTATTAVSMPEDIYLQRLRVLGAWWRLGSSVLSPKLLIERIECAAFSEEYTLADLPSVTGEEDASRRSSVATNARHSFRTA